MLRSLGFQCGLRLTRVSRERGWPQRAIVHVVGHASKVNHWMLHWDGVTYDPDAANTPSEPKPRVGVVPGDRVMVD